MYQPGSHRRKVTQDFSTLFVRCFPQFSSRKGFSRCFPSSTVTSILVYFCFNRLPLVGLLPSIFIFKEKSCEYTEIRTHVSTRKVSRLSIEPTGRSVESTWLIEAATHYVNYGGPNNPIRLVSAD